MVAYSDVKKPKIRSARLLPAVAGPGGRRQKLEACFETIMPIITGRIICDCWNFKLKYTNPAAHLTGKDDLLASEDVQSTCMQAKVVFILFWAALML